jgi:hypothetical protein
MLKKSSEPVKPARSHHIQIEIANKAVSYVGIYGVCGGPYHNYTDENAGDALPNLCRVRQPTDNVVSYFQLIVARSVNGVNLEDWRATAFAFHE